MKATLGDVREQLRRARCETLEAVDLLHAHRARVEEQITQLENPHAVLEYIDAFVDIFTKAAAEIATIDTAMDAGALSERASALRQLASNMALEQQRCLWFRDKCINRPLPHEDVRPLLNQISIDTRDQLLGFRNLSVAASHLDEIYNAAAAPSADERGFDRRSLFTKFFPKAKP
jgi:hypothetical protein